MTEELLKELRKVVAYKKTQLEEQNQRIDRIRELEKDVAVKEYMSLRNLSKCHAMKLELDDGIYYRAFDECKPSGNFSTNGIYVLSYEGKYFRGFRIRSFRQYTDIESFEDRLVSEEYFDMFESEHVILENVDTVDAKKEFLKLAVEKDQEEAIKVMAKKYSKKKESK